MIERRLSKETTVRFGLPSIEALYNDDVHGVFVYVCGVV